jgi:hypothetical protein
VTERAGLENDHCFNWAWGGSSKDPQFIQKLCFGHNRWKGRRDFKKDFRKKQTEDKNDGGPVHSNTKANKEC